MPVAWAVAAKGAARVQQSFNTQYYGDFIEWTPQMIILAGSALCALISQLGLF